MAYKDIKTLGDMVRSPEWDGFESDRMNHEYNLHGKAIWTHEEILDMERDFITEIMRYNVPESVYRRLCKQLDDIMKYHIEVGTIGDIVIDLREE